MNLTKKNIIDVGCILGAIVFGLVFLISYEGRDNVGKFFVLAIPAAIITCVFWYAIKNHKEKL